MRSEQVFNINGVERGFKLGVFTFKIIAEKTGVNDVTEVFKRISERDLGFLVSFYYCCALHYAQSKKIDTEFTEMDVSDWCDELGLEKMMEVTTELVKQYTLKN